MKDPLLGSDEERYPRLRRILRSRPSSVLLDWGSMIVFYMMEGNASTLVVSAAAFFVAATSMCITHLRSKLEPPGRVRSPKELDIGFTLTFFAFSVASVSSAWAEKMVKVWSDSLMAFALLIVVLIGVCVKRPFVVNYALEGGMPPDMAKHPYMMASFNRMALEWAAVFGAMAFVTAIAPTYRCATGSRASDLTYNNLKMVFTYFLQYAILASWFYKTFVLDRHRRNEISAWLRRSPREYAAEYGSRQNHLTTISRSMGRPDAAIHIFRDSRGDGFAVDGMEEFDPLAASVAAEEESRAAVVLADAFADDPMILKWENVGLGVQDREIRRKNSIPFFAAIIRSCRRFNHCFELDGGAAYCLCIPAWKGDEVDKCMGGEAARLYGMRFLPPKEFVDLSAITKKALRGRPHMYVYTLGANACYQGQGYGSAAMRCAMRCADERGVPSALETMTCKNRDLYQRLGFVVVGQIEVEGCMDPWFSMIREPGTR